jgi:hypothetical protein
MKNSKIEEEIVFIIDEYWEITEREMTPDSDQSKLLRKA